MIGMRRITLLIVSIALATGTLACGGTDGEQSNQTDCSEPKRIEFPNRDGMIVEDRTLGPDECYVTEGFKIANEASLTLEKGTVIQFEEEAVVKLDSNSLIADGTEDRPVRLTGTTEERGWWKGIVTTGKGVELDLEHAVVEYAGHSEDLRSDFPKSAIRLPVADTTFRMKNSEIRESGGWGLVVARTLDIDITGFESNTFQNNAEAPVVIFPKLVPVLTGSNDYEGNDRDAIRLRTGEQGSKVDEDTTFSDLGVPYWVPAENDLLVKAEDATATFESGVTVEFGEKARFMVDRGSTVVADGTSDAKVRFTGTKQERGWWGGVREANSTPELTFDLQHTIIEYAGSSERGAGLELENDVTLEMNNSIIRETSGVGFLVRNDSGISLSEFQNNEFTANGAVPVDVPLLVADDLSPDNSYGGNGDDFVRVDGLLRKEEGVILQPLGVPYLIPNQLQVKEKSRLQVNAGTTLVMGEESRILAGRSGVLQVKGTEKNKIRIRGRQQTGGFWEGVEFAKVSNDEGVDNIFRHVVINGGGPGNVTVKGPAEQLQISDVKFVNCPGSAIYLDGKLVDNIDLKGCGNLNAAKACMTEVSHPDGEDDFPTSFAEMREKNCN